MFGTIFFKNRVFQDLNQSIYAKFHAEFESGNGLFISPIKIAFTSKYFFQILFFVDVFVFVFFILISFDFLFFRGAKFMRSVEDKQNSSRHGPGRPGRRPHCPGGGRRPQVPWYLRQAPVSILSVVQSC